MCKEDDHLFEQIGDTHINTYTVFLSKDGGHSFADPHPQLYRTVFCKKCGTSREIAVGRGPS